MPDLQHTTALLSLFSDATRLRLMALLSEAELTVAELTRITDLAQSRVSTHLGKLREAGLLQDRRVGNSTFYRAAGDAMPPAAARTWDLVREQVDDDVLRSDRERRELVVRAREEDAWPDRVAGQMEHHYSPGRTWEATARSLIGLLQLGDVLDVGSGDGAMAELLADRARSYVCLDRSRRVIDAARRRLSPLPNVSLVQGDMHEMPLPDASFDEVLLLNVLTYADRPRAVLSEAFRVVRPGGRVVAVTLDEHEHRDVSLAYQHVNQGFSPEGLSALLHAAGFDVQACRVSSRERRKPYFQVVYGFGVRPAVSSVASTTEAALRATSRAS